jgi:hypothetical protein
MNRTVSSPIMVNQTPAYQPSTLAAPMPMSVTRSRNNSTSSASISMSPHFQSPKLMSLTPTITGGMSPSVQSMGGGVTKFSTKTASMNLSAASRAHTDGRFGPTGGGSGASYHNQQRRTGGRLINKYDLSSLTWLNRGGRHRNLDLCMEIALHKVKTKVDLYNDESSVSQEQHRLQQLHLQQHHLKTQGSLLLQDENKENVAAAGDSQQQQQQQPIIQQQQPVVPPVPYLYRIALAVGDIEIRDKLASSPFNMFLFRYESEQCPKHTNSNMIFFKFLCSKSMDSQQLLECDMKLSIQPLRFNIGED